MYAWKEGPQCNCRTAWISVNMSAFAATFLAEAAFDPRILLPYSHMGEAQELVYPPPPPGEKPSLTTHTLPRATAADGTWWLS